MLVDHMTAVSGADDVSFALNAAVLDEVIGAVYRQTVFVRYEQRAYALREEGVVLTPERLGEIMKRGVREAARRRGRRRARRSELDLGPDPALHRHALLHVRLRVRVPRRVHRSRAHARAAGLQ
jgi:oligoendopeptidase F